MKRLIILLFAIVLLAACAEESDPPIVTSEILPGVDPADTGSDDASATTNDQETPQGNQGAAAQTQNQSGPTATPFVRPTLPPAATIALPTVVGGPTRTLAPTSTPIPTSTSEFLIDVTPIDAQDEDAPSDTLPDDADPIDGDLTLTVAYTNMSTFLQSYPVPPTVDVLVEDSRTIFYEDNTTRFRFSIVPAGENDPVSITVDLIFDYRSTTEPLYVLFGNAYYTDETNRSYGGNLLQELQPQVQQALDDAIADTLLTNVPDIQGAAITGFTMAPSGLIIEFLIQ